MKKQELKKILKPLIKECIKEVIFEDGTLSSIISEVLKGTASQPIIQEPKRSRLETDEEAKRRLESKQNKLKENRKKILDSIGRDAYNGVDLFEGTTPMTTERQAGGGSKALDGINPRDPGVDISSFGLPPGAWKKLAGN
jgi:hypothetical protein